MAILFVSVTTSSVYESLYSVRKFIKMSHANRKSVIRSVTENRFLPSKNSGNANSSGRINEPQRARMMTSRSQYDLKVDFIPNVNVLRYVRLHFCLRYCLMQPFRFDSCRMLDCYFYDSVKTALFTFFDFMSLVSFLLRKDLRFSNTPSSCPKFSNQTSTSSIFSSP